MTEGKKRGCQEKGGDSRSEYYPTLTAEDESKIKEGIRPQKWDYPLATTHAASSAEPEKAEKNTAAGVS